MLFSPVYIEAHSRRFVSPPPRDLCALCVSALDGFFSFVFSVLQLSTLNFQPPRILNSLPLNLFADPHPLTALASIFYKNNRGPGPHRSPLSPIFRTHFQVPYPVSPAVATLTKTAGGCTNNSHSGTRDSALTTLRNSFRFTLLRTLLRLRKTQLVCFHAISHSSPKTTRGGGILPFHYRLSIEDPDPVGTVNLFPWLSPFASPNRSARIRVETP